MRLCNKTSLVQHQEMLFQPRRVTKSLHAISYVKIGRKVFYRGQDLKKFNGFTFR